MINLDQARELIIQPSLVAIGMWSQAAENLLIGTMLIESQGGTYVKQYPTGPALGPYQHEPATLIDDFKWLRWPENKDLKRLVMLSAHGIGFPDPSELIYNWRWATIMCRIHYWRADPPLPHEDDIKGLGEYWKEFWNTPLGKGRVENYVRLYTAHNKK